jgi:hypothetical protein
MLNKKLMIACVTIIAILLIPNITAITVSNTFEKNELVEISIELCDINQSQKDIVQLNKNDALDLETIFDKMKIKLENANTDQETIEVYNEVVESLDKYGLLPKGMTVKKAQKLVTNVNCNENILINDNENFNCYISGNTTWTTFYKWYWTGFRIDLMKDLKYLILLNGLIAFGVEHWDINGGSGEYYKRPSSGWIWTKGTNGVITWEGDTLWGNLSVDYLYYNLGEYYFEDWYFKGVKGFTGIKIKSDQSRFFGTAKHVKIVTEFPD